MVSGIAVARRKLVVVDHVESVTACFSLRYLTCARAYKSGLSCGYTVYGVVGYSAGRQALSYKDEHHVSYVTA